MHTHSPAMTLFVFEKSLRVALGAARTLQPHEVRAALREAAGLTRSQALRITHILQDAGVVRQPSAPFEEEMKHVD